MTQTTILTDILKLHFAHWHLSAYSLDIIRNREPIIGVKSEAYYENRFL